jgi:hypothetical protein
MPELHEIEIPQQPWSDVLLRGVEWTNDGRDIAFAVRLPDSDTYSVRDKTLHCRWASDLQLELSFAENEGGMPLTWDVTFERRDLGWKVELDFAGAGRISVCCSELELTELIRI